MKIDLKKFEEQVALGYIRKVERPGDGLILYGYTNACNYDRAWNDYTRTARGLIVDAKGTVVAKPFEKFFNLNEMEETRLYNLPDLPYEVSEKTDGSLGIIFNYNNKWYVASRGSFMSDQAIEASKMLASLNMADVPTNFTLCCEIIYPENKIVVNYGDQRKLVLLSIFNRETGEELWKETEDRYARQIGMDRPKYYNYTIAEMIALQSKLPKDEEGFVVRYSNGLRVKIKGDEYLRIHKIISEMSPLSLWETMLFGRVNQSYLMGVPEEYRGELEPMVVRLEQRYAEILREIEEDVKKLPAYTFENPTAEDRKNIGLFLKETKEIKHKSAMFAVVLKQTDLINKYAMSSIRPKGNNLV